MSYVLPALVNGKAVEWIDIMLVVLSTQITGVLEIEYEESKEMQGVGGAGEFDVARTYGKYKVTASITLLAREMEALQSIAPLGRIQNIPESDRICSYIDTAFTPHAHKLKNVRFMSNGRSSTDSDG